MIVEKRTVSFCAGEGSGCILCVFLSRTARVREKMAKLCLFDVVADMTCECVSNACVLSLI